MEVDQKHIELKDMNVITDDRDKKGQCPFAGTIGDKCEMENVMKANGHLEDLKKSLLINEMSALVNGESTSPESKDKDVKEKVEDAAKSNVEDVVVIPETMFTIKISPPGTDAFDLQVSSSELVQEIHQVLMDREDTCHRTCFTLQLEGVILDNFAELKTVEGLKEGCVLKVVEEPYTVREARIHVRHVRDLIKSLDSSDAYNGVDCQSMTFINTIIGDEESRKGSNVEAVDCTPPSYIMPKSKERPLVPLLPSKVENKGPPCMKMVTMSGWNPPPGPRKLHGDLLYLYVVTVDGGAYHITASTRGFYVNQSTLDVFNPKPSELKHLSHSLVELLGKLSPTFRKNFAQLLKKRSQRHPFERVPTPFQTFSWLAPSTEHSVDTIRAEDAFSSRLGYEEHIPGQTRDWNEETMTTRELPRKQLPERLLRERAIFKVHSDFVMAAARGAVAVIDGNVMAINPGEESKFLLKIITENSNSEVLTKLLLVNFQNNDLHGVKAYCNADVEGLYTLGTVVVDYRGYRITAQSIIPGILEREQEESVIYGSIDFGKTVVSSEKYTELLTKSAQHLKVLPHKVINSQEDEVEIYSSIECKGIRGNDGRHYILDLLRTFPTDANFWPVENDNFPEDVKALGFPRAHRHKLCRLRPELVESFIEHRYMMFIRYAASLLMQEQQKNQTNNKEKEDQNEQTESKTEKKEEGQVNGECTPQQMTVENGEQNAMKADLPITKDTILEQENTLKTLAATKDTIGENHKDIIKKAAQFAGSLSNTEFDIRFNPDIYSDGVLHAHQGTEQFEKERKIIIDAAHFLLGIQIPTFVRECQEHTIAPLDGATLTEMLHQRGINMRYLGSIADIVKNAALLTYLYKLLISELITRAAKHLYKTYMQGVGMVNLAAAKTQFLNCYLSSFANPVPAKTDEEMNGHGKKKNKKKKNRAIPTIAYDNNAWTNLTPSDLWANIKTEIKEYFHFELEGCEDRDAMLQNHQIQKVTLLREFSRRMGLQLLIREYVFDGKQKATFTEDDILNVFPLPKHINPVASDAYNFYQSGQARIQQGLYHDATELIQESLNLFTNVYGPMHSEIGTCMRTLAKLHYINAEIPEALDMQEKAVMISERCNGLDHPTTMTEYMHLALYCFASNQVTNALKLMYRARYLAMLVFGEDHPEFSQIDSNIGLVLHAVGEYDLSIKFLQSALCNSILFHGASSLKAALGYHLLARVQSCKGNFRGALKNEKGAYQIYKQHYGETHEKTKESSECLRYLTHQAVTLQKTMNEIKKAGPRAAMQPFNITPPSFASVLETIDMINGIFRIPFTVRAVPKGATAKNNQTENQKEKQTENVEKVKEKTEVKETSEVKEGEDNATVEDNVKEDGSLDKEDEEPSSPASSGSPASPISDIVSDDSATR
ncbi:clustered mitochondria protein homolog [Anneissia japonica]|uniref:clustered mitochondria protein homolog n=1 Tax=Anneissia japonica TaxID=1529436 RepID=UPI0014257087|nr:clustered mitochondria protein homolog [Anneissia japonica]